MIRRTVILLLAITALLTVIEPRITADVCISGDQGGPYCIDGIIPDADVATTTTLTANVTKTATAFAVVSTTNFIAGDYALVDQEKVLVKSVTNGTSMIVVRAQLDSTAVTHASGARITDLKPINNDPSVGLKELGPKNADFTKLNVINTCVPSNVASKTCLDDTNPNAQVDLNTVWLKGGTGPGPDEEEDPNDLWLYFGWSRDSDSGSGLIGVELHKLAVDAACDYANKTEQQLKDTCNPFKNRRDGDILLLWDQQGGAREVYIRVFVENPEPNPTHAGVWGPQISLTDENSPYLGTAFAQYGNGGFRGEMAVDLSKVVPPTGQACESFANVIPGTITGNSDQADYKDIVLKKFPLISNCGGLKIIKDTNPDGGTGNFDFLLTGASSIFPGDVDEDCNDADDQTQCAGTLVGDDAEVEIAGLINGTYTLTEPTLPSDYALESISCVLGEDTYTGASFPVQTGGQTVCTITNTLKTGTLRVTKQITNGFGLTSTCPDYSFKINGGDNQTWEADCSNDYTFNVGTQHTIVENGGLPSGFVFDSVTNCTNVTIVANQTVECIVKNKATQATPSLVTGQLIILHDRAHITGIRRGANDDSLQAEGSSVTFALYNGLVCAGNPVATETIPLDFPNATNTSITVGTVTGFTSPFNSLGTFSPSWSWKVIYSGNAYNAASPAATAACNEAIAITISGNGNIPQ